ncbi:MAG: pyridoxal phosphate-dependent aminotransferase [Gammaproteobacteria bacterium]|nr:pyridoxal phosphate-dependent aminotransferase [Gammaproteobacteria bacterium]
MTDDAPVPAVARRMDEIAPFHVMDVLARARALERAGRTIVHMEIGEPDFATPAPVIEAGMRALRAGLTHYTPATGLPGLRAAIAGFYRSREGIEVDPGRIVVTPGASGALQLILGVLLNPGDRVLMADPGYPCNRHFVRMFEGEAAGVPVDAATGYQLTAALLEAHWTPDTRAVLLASPSNPTGTLIAPDELARIAALAEARGAALIVDEIYQGLVYEGRAETALHQRGTVFVLNSFSKYFCMTGWRIGWLVAPERFIPAIDRLAQNIFLATSTPAQHAALACFEPATLALLEQRREEFRTRRDFLLPALRGLGFDIPVTPQGAFYLYADCSRHAADSYAFCLDLLERAGVAITPGRDFGHHRPERHVRFAYTTALDQLGLGVERLGEYLGEG